MGTKNLNEVVKDSISGKKPIEEKKPVEESVNDTSTKVSENVKPIEKKEVKYQNLNDATASKEDKVNEEPLIDKDEPRIYKEDTVLVKEVPKENRIVVTDEIKLEELKDRIDKAINRNR